MKKKSVLIGYLLAFISICFFSFNGLGARFLTTDEGLNPFLVIFLRFFGGVLFLSLFLPFFTKKKDFIKLFKGKNILYKDKNFIFSSIFFLFTIIFFIFGTKYSSASNVVLIQSLAPILVAIITLYFYPKESHNLSYRKIFFISIIASMGSSLLVSDSSLLKNNSGTTKMLGDIFAFISMIFFAFFSFYYVELRKKFNDGNGLIITTSFLLFALILISPIILFYYNQLFNLSNTAIIFISIISFGATGLAYLTWFFAGRYLTAITLVMIFNIVGLTTMITEYLFYGSTKNEITYKLYLGATLIIGSIYYIQYINSKKNKHGK